MDATGGEQLFVGGATAAHMVAAEDLALYQFTAANLDGNLFKVFFDFVTPGRCSCVTS